MTWLETLGVVLGSVAPWVTAIALVLGFFVLLGATFGVPGVLIAESAPWWGWLLFCILQTAAVIAYITTFAYAAPWIGRVL